MSSASSCWQATQSCFWQDPDPDEIDVEYFHQYRLYPLAVKSFSGGSVNNCICPGASSYHFLFRDFGIMIIKYPFSILFPVSLLFKGDVPECHILLFTLFLSTSAVKPDSERND